MRTTTDSGPEPLPFAVALGHRLRQVREKQGNTAAELAQHSQRLGLGWDRPTVARIELGQRQVSAKELLLMAALYGVSVRDLLPTETVRMTNTVTATPTGLADALTDVPGLPNWHFEGLVEEALAAVDKMKPALRALQDRLPGANFVTIAMAAEHQREEATVKAARRLDATAEEVAVAAQQLWARGVAAERDARVEEMGSAVNVRARQARRGHVTRVLLAELAPVVAQVRSGTSREEETDRG